VPRRPDAIRPASHDGAAISLRGVTKRYGSHLAVERLDLAVPAGSLCGFLGPNGAGKSTTIRMVMSITHPDEGEARVLGGSALASKDRIGYLPEERGLYKTMRVLEWLVYIGRLKGLDAGEAARRAREWLGRIELPAVERKRCQELSKGMQQKVQFVSSVLHGPELLILDEPFSGLDPVNARLLERLIREFHSDGRTVIFSTHQMHVAESICDRVVLIHRGRKLLDATLGEVRAAFDPRTVAAEPEGGVTAATIARLGALPGVRRASAARDGVSVDLELADGAAPRGLMQAALEAVPLVGVRLRQVRLDDVFIDLVAGDQVDEAEIASVRAGLGEGSDA
jgi:ABC-2 type transport system ATP-binding protein